MIFIGIYKFIMKKRVSITRDQLVEHIRKSISKNLMEGEYSSDVDRPTQPREKEVKNIFGSKYSNYIPNDVIRYMRKNPALIFERLFDIYGEDAYTYLDKAKEKMGDSSEPMMEQDTNDSFKTTILKVMVFVRGQMVTNTMVNGKTTKRTV